MTSLSIIHYIMETLRNQQQQPLAKTDRDPIPATVQVPIIDAMELTKRAALRDDYRQVIKHCAILIQDEIERDPELKKIITSLNARDERVLPALAAAGAWLVSPAGLTTIGIVGGTVAGWLSVDK